MSSSALQGQPSSYKTVDLGFFPEEWHVFQQLDVAKTKEFTFFDITSSEKSAHNPPHREQRYFISSSCAITVSRLSKHDAACVMLRSFTPSPAFEVA